MRFCGGISGTLRSPRPFGQLCLCQRPFFLQITELSKKHFAQLRPKTWTLQKTWWGCFKFLPRNLWRKSFFFLTSWVLGCCRLPHCHNPFFDLTQLHPHFLPSHRGYSGLLAGSFWETFAIKWACLWAASFTAVAVGGLSRQILGRMAVKEWRGGWGVWKRRKDSARSLPIWRPGW